MFSQGTFFDGRQREFRCRIVPMANKILEGFFSRLGIWHRDKIPWKKRPRVLVSQITGISLYRKHLVDILRPRQNYRYFGGDIFNYVFLTENTWLSIEISLKFVPKVRINNIPALIQVMAWCRPEDKPLSEPMMVNSLRHICVTRPQWVKADRKL